MPLEDVQQILQKYRDKEDHVNELLQRKTAKKEAEIDKALGCSSKKYLTVEEAITRNRGILKELEVAKGNLRSKAIYSPSEMQWEAICKRYQANPSLPVTSWRCYMPVYI